MHLTHHTFDIVAEVVLTCLVLSAILPPYEVFNFAPRFQVVYRVILLFVTQIGSVNLRSVTMKIYPQYQQQITGANLGVANGGPWPKV